MYSNSTVNQKEVAKFSAIANEWWNSEGKFKHLHLMNPARISFIKQKISSHYQLDDIAMPFNNIEIIDVGCGGGLLSIPMAKLGAMVTGIDASSDNIKIAQSYADQLQIPINYVHNSIEEYTKYNKQYDVVLCLEVIEHVDNIDNFIHSLSKLVKANGMLIISTINRTFKSYIFAIGAAEYLLRYLPIGTHDFNKFVKPHEIYNLLQKNNLSLAEMRGLSYNIISQKWALTDNIDINYIIYIRSSMEKIGQNSNNDI